jgi:transposase
VKTLYVDATGICVFAKRLDTGVFSLPAATRADASHVEIDDATLDALLDGLASMQSPDRCARLRARCRGCVTP